MAARRAATEQPRPSPRPHTDPGPAAGAKPPSGTGLARPGQVGGAQQLVATAGEAVVTVARVGRLFGRVGWRVAKQLPGANLVEAQAQRLRQSAAAELFRLLEMPQQFLGSASFEESRVMMLVQNASSDPAPLRTAMSELLHRATETAAGTSREYLFGTIVSQLVPDEARVLAALAAGKRVPVVDVVAKHVGRSATRPVLANASLLGSAAGLSPVTNAATYLSRLHSFGLIEFGPAADDLAKDYDKLALDSAITEARTHIERNKLGSAKLIRKTVTLSPLGRDFWAACAPS